MDLHLTLVQPDLAWEDPGRNREQIGNMLGEVGGNTDLIILPETFATGFSMNARAMAETMEGPTVQWMYRKAETLNAVVCGSLIISDGGKYYNRMVWMRPDGSYAYYNKRHRFSMAGEDKVFEAGSERVVATLKGWRVLLQICYDLRFPVWGRNHGDYDVYLNVANWPQPRNNAWKSLLKARAIENQAYAIGVNRFGTDGNGTYHTGDSAVIDPMGEVLAAIPELAGTVSARLSYNYLQEIRQKLPFLDDRDSFTIIQ